MKLFDILSELDYVMWEATHPFVSSQIADSIKIPTTENSNPAHLKAIPGITKPATASTNKTESKAHCSTSGSSVATPVKPVSKVYYSASESTVTATKNNNDRKKERKNIDVEECAEYIFSRWLKSFLGAGRKADKGNALLKEVVNHIMFSSRELDQNHSIESKKIINGIGSVFGLKELYPDVSTADLRMYDPTFEATVEYNPDIDIIVHISDIVKWKNNPDFMVALEKKLAERGYSVDCELLKV